MKGTRMYSTFANSVPTPHRRGFTFLELQVALVVFAVALSGLYPLVVMQSKHAKKIDSWFSSKSTYYLVPSSDEWARKLGAVASMQTQDPGVKPPAPVLLIDNGETGYVESGTGWGAETQKQAYKETLRWNSAGTGGNTASWQFTSISAGWYDVQVTWLESGNRASNAPYQVYDASKLRGTFLIDQTKAPTGAVLGDRPWQSLATVSISSGSVSVILSDNADGRVIADGVRLIAVRNVVQMLSLEKSLTSENVTAHVAVTVKVPQ